MNMNQSDTRKVLTIAILGLALAGCGSGGGDGDINGNGSGSNNNGSGNGNGGTGTAPSALAALQGIWQSPEGAGNSVSAIALPDGQLWALTSAGNVTRLVKATLSTQPAGFGGEGKSYILGSSEASSVVSATVTASVVEKTRLSGVFNPSGTQPEAFALAYQPRYDAPAVLSEYAGTWQAQLGPGVVSWTIGNTGTLSGTRTTGCTYTGQLSTRTEQKAVLNAAVTENCTGTVVPLGGVAVFNADKTRIAMLLTTEDERVGVALSLNR